MPESVEAQKALTGDAARSKAISHLLSVIVPCANEEEVLHETHRRLTAALTQIGMAYEIVYVDDGSTDSTMRLLRAIQVSDSHVRVVSFSRNFGHQMAITAGMEHAAGDALVVIDADLQDPPEVITEFVQKWCAGYDVAYGVRTEREGETVFKLWTARLFYRLIGRMSDTKIDLDTGDFRLLDRRVADALLRMPERDRFVRGMVSWLGFSQVAVPYRRAARLAGKTKYPLVKMLRFAMDGIVSFSTTPLKLATYFGFFVSGISLLGILYALYVRLFERNWVQGWTSIVIAILFLGGVQLICMGIIGEYVGRIYGESKRRPLYLVRARLGFDESHASPHLEPLPRQAAAHNDGSGRASENLQNTTEGRSDGSKPEKAPAAVTDTGSQNPRGDA